MKSLLIKRIKDSKGFSLVELLLVVLLIVIIVSIISGAYILSINTSREVVDVTTSVIDSKTAMYRVSKDLREIIDISSAEADDITFRSNVDDDEGYEVLEYYLSAEEGYYNLYREVDGGGASLVVSKIVNINIFTYYTGVNIPEGGMDAVSEEELGNIKIIEININIDQGGTESNRTMDLKTSITLRNRI